MPKETLENLLATLQTKWDGINIHYNTITFAWEVCEQTGPDGMFERNDSDKKFKTVDEMSRHFCKKIASKWNLGYVTD